MKVLEECVHPESEEAKEPEQVLGGMEKAAGENRHGGGFGAREVDGKRADRCGCVEPRMGYRIEGWRVGRAAAYRGEGQIGDSDYYHRNKERDTQGTEQSGALYSRGCEGHLRAVV